MKENKYTLGNCKYCKEFKPLKEGICKECKNHNVGEIPQSNLPDFMRDLFDRFKQN